MFRASTSTASSFAARAAAAAPAASRRAAAAAAAARLSSSSSASAASVSAASSSSSSSSAAVSAASSAAAARAVVVRRAASSSSSSSSAARAATRVAAARASTRAAAAAVEATSAGGAAAAAAEAEAPGQYSMGLRVLHWFMGISIMGLVGSGYVAGQIPNDPKKTDKATLEMRGKMMHMHESFGLLMLVALVPRIGLRMVQGAPKPLPGPAWEHFLGKVSHTALYAAITFMPVSGLAFGYFSCWGVPFFAWEVPGMSKEHYGDKAKAIEAFFYTWHHKVGQALEFLVPAHIGAVAFHHLIRGHALLYRMNPFASAATKTIKK